MVQLKRVISILGAMLLAATGAAVQANDLRAAAVCSEIRAEHEVYRLVRGGNVDLTDGVEQSASTRQSSAGWQARLGRFELSIDPRAGTRSTSSAVPDTTYQLAFNPRTGNPAVVTGMIITSWHPEPMLARSPAVSALPSLPNSTIWMRQFFKLITPTIWQHRLTRCSLTTVW